MSVCIIRRGLAEGRRNGLYLGIGALAVLAFLASFLVLKLPDISSGQNPQKEIFDALHTFKGQILQSRDSALGRVDLVGFTDYPHLMDIYVDGTAGMPMYRFNGQFGSPNPAVEELKSEFPGYFPLQSIRAAAMDEALIIGPGGGRDILLAKMAGFQKITAVEVNPEIVRVVKEQSDFNGNIYAQEDVNLTIGEGRSFLRAHSHQYDMIMFSLPVTNTSQGLGSYALTENYLYTTEAISEYLKNLSDQGALVFTTHNDLELLRLLTMTLAAFQEKNISTAEAMQYLFVVGSADYPVLVVKKQKIPLNESQEILKAAFNQTWFMPGSSFFPQVRSPFLNKMLLGMEMSQVTAEDLVSEGDKRGYDIRPVSDLSPFFYKLENFLPSSLKNVFYFSIAAVVVFLSFPCMSILYKNRKKKHSDKLNTKIYLFFGVYFAMIGAGFMIFEVTMIQRFMLVLGNPVFSMSTIIFTILVGAGLGSLASSRMHVHRLPKGMILACGIIACLILVYQAGLSSMLYFLSTGSMFFKALLTFVFLGPLGFVMGFPLPVAIRLVKLFNMSGMIPWMLAINGASSVLGSALTVVLAMVYGYGTALLAAAICYGIVSVSSYLIAKEARQGFFNSSEISFNPARLVRTTSMNQSSQKGSPRK